jgi:hypothetical protein
LIEAELLLTRKDVSIVKDVNGKDLNKGRRTRSFFDEQEK